MQKLNITDLGVGDLIIKPRGDNRSEIAKSQARHHQFASRHLTLFLATSSRDMNSCVHDLGTLVQPLDLVYWLIEGGTITVQSR